MDNQTQRTRQQAEDAEYARENSPLSGGLVMVAFALALIFGVASFF